MSKESYSLSAKEAEEQIRQLKKVFSVVRILKKDEIGAICSKENGSKLQCPCYSFWEKDNPCDNCTSIRALHLKSDQVKIEFSKDGAYFVVSRYLEIDGRPCVMELLREFDDSNIVDISGQEKLIKHINMFYEKTYVDVLTGSYNRRYYEEKIKESSFKCCVAMIDLDDFKVYNDAYGHIAGDYVLKVFAKELQKNLESEDRLIRYGGDEFLLLIPNVTRENFAIRLQTILKPLKNIVFPGYAEINLTFSAGATFSDSENIVESVKRADRFLYCAKAKKNTLVTDDNIQISDSNDKINILVVDDSSINRDILCSILSNEFNVIEADGGRSCVKILEQSSNHISLVLLDILMPDMDGFEVLKFMRNHHLLESIPVITITGDESPLTIRRAYEMGVSDFISRPFDAKVVYRRVLNTINLYQKQRRLLFSVSSEILQKEKCSHILVDILSQLTEFRSGIGKEHITNINKITELLLIRLMKKTDKYKLKKEDIYLIATASALHDIGKVEIDTKILNKPGKLTKEEFEIVKKHTVLGAAMVMNIREYQNEPLVKYAYQICLYHHEKFDGKGYPKGLKGDDIPIVAQVVSMADVYDALTAERVYKKAYSQDEALRMILDGQCGQFNPLLVECLLEIKDSLKKDKHGEII